MKPAPSMALLLLALLAGGASASASLRGSASREVLASQAQSFQYNNKFPFSQCASGSTTFSPYKLDVVGRTSSMNSQGVVAESVTFELVHNALSDYEEEDNCYDVLKQDLHTIGFSAEETCDDGYPIKADVNGRTVHGKWQHTQFGSVLKFSNLKLKQADGTKITVQLAGLCNSMELLFGSQVEFTMMSKVQKCCPTSLLDFHDPLDFLDNLDFLDSVTEEARDRKLSASYTRTKPPTPQAPKYPASPLSPKAPVNRYLLEEEVHGDRKLSAYYTRAKPPTPQAPKYPATPRAPKYL